MKRKNNLQLLAVRIPVHLYRRVRKQARKVFPDQRGYLQAFIGLVLDEATAFGKKGEGVHFGSDDNIKSH